MSELEVPVLIVGGSLVGMSTALLLGHYGVEALAVEHHRGTAIHPRAAQISQRTMEIFRTVGIEHIVRRKSDDQFVQDGAIMAVETLAGKELAYFIANLNEGIRDVSPTERVFVSQSLLEPLLKSRAEDLGAALRFGTDMVAFEQDADGVTAILRDRDSGGTQTVRAPYMVAADGAHSPVRDGLGIAMRGHGSFSNSVTIYFRADIAPLLRGRNLSVIYVNNPTLRGFFRVEKPFDRGFLAVNALGDPNDPITDVATGLTESRCVELVRIALGAGDLPVIIENVMPWKAEADVADRFRSGCILLAGDAAHVMPPNGGFGGNTGVQDAQNLAWKLAMVLDGTAGPALLDSYEPERRPAAQFTTEQAFSRYVTRTAPYLKTEDLAPVEDDLNIELGYRYRSPAVIADGADDGRAHDNPRRWNGRPGTRAPHVWLDRQGERISTLDLFGRWWVLVAGPKGDAWDRAAAAAAERLSLRLDVHRLGTAGLRDPDGGCADAYGLGVDGAVLVRPDGFVGWRATDAAEASPEIVGRVLRRLLSRSGSPNHM
jgi:2-polyprenyl-6-methoxyphenol hydroxylase-like FAD-dependent oxidoreductase